MNPTAFVKAPARYKRYPGDPDRVYRALCYTLSDRIEQAEWGEFSREDWQVLPRMAEQEGVAPLMYWKLKGDQTLDGRLPDAAFQSFKMSYYQTLAHNTLLFKELERILEALDEAGIPVVVLKGATLAQTIYKDIGLRPMGDLDLLIEEARIPSARVVIQKLGYEIETPERTPGFNQQFDHHISLRNLHYKELAVEIHWAFIAGRDDWRSPAIDWFWDQSICINDHIRILLPTAHLLFLAAHSGLQHGLAHARMVWLFDVYLLINNSDQQINYDQISDIAKSIYWDAPLFYVLQQIYFYFEADVPRSTFELLSTNMDPKSKRLVDLKSSIVNSDVMFNLVGFSALNNRDKFFRLVAELFPSRKFIHSRYQPKPKWLWPICYFYRWYNIAWKLVSTVSGLIKERLSVK